MTDDNLPEESGFSETPDEERTRTDTGEELEQVRARVVELEELLAQKNEELTRANTRLAELERLRVESEERLAQAVSSYKALVVTSNPGVLEELITGGTIEDVNASLEGARSIVGKVKQGLEAEMASARVPAGAPQRTPVDLSALSPREKIQYGIGGRR